MKFGVFVSPIHSPKEDPTIALRRDVELAQNLENFGFDEFWVGEHHSTGWETICSPEVFLSYVAACTHRIRLGTGVVSLPYHHPFNTAGRMVLLDHLTRGRVIFGVGPGALATDAAMYGLEPAQLRPMLEESLDAVIRLLRGETVTQKSANWELYEAQLQILPYQAEEFEIAVTCLTSPSGAKLAGRYGASMLSLSATSPASIKALHTNWQVLEEQAEEFGQPADRAKWRLVTPMHIADTAEQARAEVERGLPGWIHYLTKVSALGVVPEQATTSREYVDALVGGGFAVIGAPDDAAAQIRRLQEASGGFGTLLLWHHEWASWEATLRSYRLFATEVAPQFGNGALERLVNAEDLVLTRREELHVKSMAAREDARVAYEKERESKKALAGRIRPKRK